VDKFQRFGGDCPQAGGRTQSGQVAVTGTATANELETLMPYLVPPRTPLSPEQVHRAFAYLMALHAGGCAAVAAVPVVFPAVFVVGDFRPWAAGAARSGAASAVHDLEGRVGP
jgi:hypothetical protein